MTDFNSGTRVKRWKLLRISFFYNKALSFSISNSALYGWVKLSSLFLFYIRHVVCRGTPVSSVHVPWVKVGSEWDGTWTSAFIFETKWLNLTASNEKTWKKTTFICTCDTSNSYAIFYVINKYLKKKNLCIMSSQSADCNGVDDPKIEHVTIFLCAFFFSLSNK